MLSYQHIYHAGNFADVQKHAVLCALLKFLVQKPQKFCVLDTHAGRGLYDLSSAEAQKLGEFNSGVMPFWQSRAAAKTPLSDYLQTVAAFNNGEELKLYPGSAKFAQHLMRKTDRLVLIERHPGEFSDLKESFKDTPEVRIEQKDGFQGMITELPFAERRGLVLVDPSYEIKTEYAYLPKQLEKAWKKWPQGQFMIWYPMLDAGLHHQMLSALRQSSIKDVLVSELSFGSRPKESFGLYGSGVIVINPPFGFETVLTDITQYIANHLPLKADSSVFWLDNRKINPETGLLSET